MQVVSILQQQLVHRVSFGITGRRLLVAICAVLLRIDIRAAAGQQNGVAALDLLHQLNWCLVEFDAHRLSTGRAHSLFILRQRTLSILAVPGMRHGNGNPRHSHFRFSHLQFTKCFAGEPDVPARPPSKWTGETPVPPSYDLNSPARSRPASFAADSSEPPSAAAAPARSHP